LGLIMKIGKVVLLASVSLSISSYNVSAAPHANLALQNNPLLQNVYGSTWSTYGNTTYGSFGSGGSATYSSYGNQTYGTYSGGGSSTWSSYGNQTYGTYSGGGSTTCSRYGNQTYCN